jgi:hypothetical protein
VGSRSRARQAGTWPAGKLANAKHGGLDMAKGCRLCERREAETYDPTVRDLYRRMVILCGSRWPTVASFSTTLSCRFVCHRAFEPFLLDVKDIPQIGPLYRASIIGTTGVAIPRGEETRSRERPGEYVGRAATIRQRLEFVMFPPETLRNMTVTPDRLETSGALPSLDSETRTPPDRHR